MPARASGIGPKKNFCMSLLQAAAGDFKLNGITQQHTHKALEKLTLFRKRSLKIVDTEPSLAEISTTGFEVSLKIKEIVASRIAGLEHDIKHADEDSDDESGDARDITLGITYTEDQIGAFIDRFAESRKKIHEDHIYTRGAHFVTGVSQITSLLAMAPGTLLLSSPYNEADIGSAIMLLASSLVFKSMDMIKNTQTYFDEETDLLTPTRAFDIHSDEEEIDTEQDETKPILKWIYLSSNETITPLMQRTLLTDMESQSYEESSLIMANQVEHHIHSFNILGKLYSFFKYGADTNPRALKSYRQIIKTNEEKQSYFYTDLFIELNNQTTESTSIKSLTVVFRISQKPPKHPKKRKKDSALDKIKESLKDLGALPDLSRS